MPNFVFAFHGGHTPEGEEEQAKMMAEWGAWYGELGPNIVDPGNPVGMSKTVSKDGVADNGGANPLSGYSVISADSIDAATELAKGCPMVKHGNGSVEVAEVHHIEM
ncbi:YciI family protein [uncultured Litoreibacter sp.]|uniref:YciI family protein n=1 Tax=uncultured Litoreibacter sp. TaxID=1392394 RepID=UPI00260C15D2|nr:YciI family protein [uncultured Litoreibacter sp.]